MVSFIVSLQEMEMQQMLELLKPLHQKLDAMQEEMTASHKEIMAKLDAHHEKIMACLGKTETTDLEANPEEMKSEEVHREVSKEDAVMKSSEAPKKRHRGRHLAAGNHYQPEGRTRGNCGSWKKLAVAGRRMARRTRVAWRKVYVVRKNKTRDKVARGTLKDGSSGRNVGRNRKASRE
jgi:hypothetical protein